VKKVRILDVHAMLGEGQAPCHRGRGGSKVNDME